MEITKKSTKFKIVGKISERWFPMNYKSWEKYTFEILDYFSKGDRQTYIDIGSWIGPTVLYASSKFEKVVAIEPDPVALKELEGNIAVNNFSNISVVGKALSTKDGKTSFGGHGMLGNSESTMLVDTDKYMERSKRKPKGEIAIVEVETICIQTLMAKLDLNPHELGLIKMDIEGGEIVVVPCLRDFLNKYKIPLYISFHYVFLCKKDVHDLINILFDIYDKCFIFRTAKAGNFVKKAVDKTYVIENCITSMVFE
jgi:FkbM family methyltransferase